jgi:hypothetical protein
MNRSRYLPTFVLATALTVPYGGPSVCAVFNPMMMASAVSEDSNDAVGGPDAPACHCDLAECSTVVVAPVPSVAAPVGQLRSFEPCNAPLSSPVLKEATPPLTPPPTA